MKDRHGHLCCDKCGVTGCGHVVDRIAERAVKARIRHVSCPFGWCKAMNLCILCRRQYRDFLNIGWHVVNGCQHAAMAAAMERTLDLPPGAIQEELRLLMPLRKKLARRKKKT